MGVTFQKVRISNPRRPGTRAVEVEFLVDTGAIFSVVPRTLLRKLGIRPMDRQQFSLADGTKQEYPVGEAFFELGDKRATSRFVFAPPSVTPLLGAFTLESLGLMVNPVTRELAPMRLIPARASEGARRNSDPVHPRLSSQEPTAIVS